MRAVINRTVNKLIAVKRHKYRDEVLAAEVEKDLDYTRQLHGVEIRSLTARQYVLYLRYARQVRQARERLGNAFFKTLTPEQKELFARKYDLFYGSR